MSAGMLHPAEQIQTPVCVIRRTGWVVTYRAYALICPHTLHFTCEVGAWSVYGCEEQACVKSAGFIWAPLTAQVKHIVPSVIQMSHLSHFHWFEADTHTHSDRHKYTSTDLKTWDDPSHFCTEPEYDIKLKCYHQLHESCPHLHCLRGLKSLFLIYNFFYIWTKRETNSLCSFQQEIHRRKYRWNDI